MIVTLLAAAAVVAAAPSAPPVPRDWLQGRISRVAAAAGRNPDTVTAILSNDAMISLDGSGAILSVPRELVATAPSVQAVDGLLAMMLAYRNQDSGRRGASLGATAAYVALVAATGGASDPAEGKGSKQIPIGADQRTAAVERNRDKARRGVRWAEAAGVCTAEFADYLRLLARSPVGNAGPTARRLLADMGMLASPSMEPCSATDDPEFAAVQAMLAKPGT